MLPRLAACVCLLALIGCAVGPDWHSPTPALPPAWAGPAPRAASRPASMPATARVAGPVDMAQWWTSFNDPKLTALVRQAVGGNLDVLLAESAIRQARAAKGVAVGALFPTLNTANSYSRLQSPGFSGRNGGAGPIGNAYALGLAASWQIDIFGGIRRNIEATEADLLAAEENRNGVILTLASEVATDYINLRGYQRQIAIAREELKDQQHTADLTRQKLAGGLVSHLDVAQADAVVASTASTIPPLETAARQEIYSLSVLLGRPPADLLSELAADAPIPPVPPAVPEGLPSALLRRRPDIRAAEAQIHAATALVGVATANLFPQFSLTANAGYSSSLLQTLTQSSSGLWSFGPAMNWQLFNGLANLSAVDVQKALQEQSVLTYQRTILTALEDVENALIAYAKEQEHRKLLQDAVVASREALNLSLQQYTQGLTDFTSVLTAEQTLYGEESSLVQSTTAVSTDLVSLYLALGGGWDATAAPVPATQPAARPIWQPATQPAVRDASPQATRPAR